MINGLSFDIEDWFQVENLRGACSFDKWDIFESRVERNTEKILILLDRYRQKATFFVLGWIAERKPDLIRKISACGHEIASHGYKHEIVYKLTPEEFRKDLRRSKMLLEDIIGEKIVGYRAPNFSITGKSEWAIGIMKEEGFLYDSSIFPTSLHDRYGFKKVNDSSFFNFANGLRELPLTVYNKWNINVPVAGGAYFRLIPYNIFKHMLGKINKLGKEFIFYLHPWELDKDQPRQKIHPQYYFRHYFNLHKTERKLNLLLGDFRFQPLRKFINERQAHEKA